MKKAVIVLLFFCCCINLYGQAIYFNNRYDFNGGLEVAWSILEIDSGYVIAGGGGTRLIITKLDSNGVKKQEKIYQKTGYVYYSGTSGSLIKTSDGGYALGGSVDLGNVSNGMLWRFDENIDTLWTKTFGDTTTDQLFYQCKQTPDSGFVLIGVTTKIDADGDIWLVKTDREGNFQWEKTYGGNAEEYGYNIELTQDGGYILGGNTKSFGAGNLDSYIIKTDSLGNLQWSKTYGGIYSDCRPYIYPFSDKSYLVASCEGKYILSGSYTQTVIIVMHIDSIGEIIWKKEYGPERYVTVPLSIQITQDSSFVIAGPSDNNKGTPNGNGWDIGFILKITAQGDSLWYREFEYDSCEKNEDYVRDMKPTSDGGVIVAGFFVPSSFYCSDTGTQDMWVLKLDSCGCPYKDCDLSCSYPSGIKEIGATNIGVAIGVWPNPTDGKFTIEIFDNSEAEKPYDVRIYDILGMEIKQIELQSQRSDSYRIEVDISDCDAGLYLIQIRGENIHYNSRVFKY